MRITILSNSQKVRTAKYVLLNGGVITYPTEGVFGLGCIADDYVAVNRILKIKNRKLTKGLIIIISDVNQIKNWIDINIENNDLHSSNENPITWILPANNDAPHWIKGNHSSIAVRKTTHPIARKLCISTNSALISTSANIANRPPARNVFILHRLFSNLVDYMVPGNCGTKNRPSEIRNLVTGDILRQ